MSYEVFKVILSRNGYFRRWDNVRYNDLTESLKKRIYDKYVNKCKVFQRDNFKCLNTECKTPNSLLTLHHVKFKKNGGKDKERNGITLCKTCHKGFHRAKRKIVLPDSSALPSNLSGHTFQLIKENTVDWKKIRIEMKKFRKSLNESHINLSLEDVAILMKFLEFVFDSDDD